MTSQAELQKAFEEGRKHFGKGMGSHSPKGELHAPYKSEKDPELLRAWLAGYDSARGRTM